MYHAWKAKNRTAANQANGEANSAEDELRTPHCILVEASKHALMAADKKEAIVQEQRFFRIPFTRHGDNGTEAKGW